MKKIQPIIFYIVFFLFCIAFSTTANGYDYDFWARLIAGMSVVQSGVVLKHDFLSYTPTHTWFDHEWGSGVIFYLTQHFLSSAGLILLQGLLVFLIFFTITKIVKLRGVKTTTPYNFLFYFFAFIAMSATINEPIRSQMFSFLFFTVFLYILELARSGLRAEGEGVSLGNGIAIENEIRRPVNGEQPRRGNNKPLFLLPLIMILWNNLHGGCVAGIGLIVIYIIGELLNKAEFKKYIYVLIPTTLVLVINPWGFSYLSFLFGAVTMKRPDVMEWWGLFSKFYLFKYMKFKIFALFMLLTEFLVIKKDFSYKSLDKTKFLTLAITLILAIQHVKMLPFFTIASVCFIYDDFYTIFNQLTAKIQERLNLKNLTTIKEVVVYGVILIFILSKMNAKSFEPIANFDKYPLKEIEFIKLNNIKGKLLINFGQGSYAAYKLYPNNLIYMDGRYEEVYYDYTLPILKKFYLLENGGEKMLSKFSPDIIVIEKNYPVYNILKISKKWKLLYSGKYFGVFTRAKDAKKSYKKPPEDIKYYKKTLFDTNITFTKNPLN